MNHVGSLPSQILLIAPVLSRPPLFRVAFDKKGAILAEKVVKELLGVKLIAISLKGFSLVKFLNERFFEGCEERVDDHDFFLDFLDCQELGQVSLCVSDVAHRCEGEAHDAYEDVNQVFGHGEQHGFEEGNGVLLLHGTLSSPSLLLICITFLHFFF